MTPAGPGCQERTQPLQEGRRLAAPDGKTGNSRKFPSRSCRSRSRHSPKFETTSPFHTHTVPAGAAVILPFAGDDGGLRPNYFPAVASPQCDPAVGCRSARELTSVPDLPGAGKVALDACSVNGVRCHIQGRRDDVANHWHHLDDRAGGTQWQRDHAASGKARGNGK